MTFTWFELVSGLPFICCPLNENIFAHFPKYFDDCVGLFFDYFFMVCSFVLIIWILPFSLYRVQKDWMIIKAEISFVLNFHIAFILNHLKKFTNNSHHQNRLSIFYTETTIFFLYKLSCNRQLFCSSLWIVCVCVVRNKLS